MLACDACHSQREEPDLNDIAKLHKYLPLASANSHSELACKVIEWAIKTGIRLDDPPRQSATRSSMGVTLAGVKLN